MNEDEDLMHALGQLAREDAARHEDDSDTRWAALSAGTLSAAEAAALRAEAANSPASQRAHEAYRPLGPDFQNRLVDRLQTELRDTPAAPTTPTDPTEAAAQPAAKVLPLRRPVTRRWHWPLAAAAAAILLFLGWPQPGLDPLPAYALSLEGGRAATRSIPSTMPAEAATVRLAAGDQLVLLLRPDTAVREPLAARVFLDPGRAIDADTVLHPIAVEPVISATGSVRMVLTVGRELPTAPGRQQLVVLVGRRDKLPAIKLPDIATLNTGTDGLVDQDADDWMLLRTAVEIEE